jgi:Chaperone of endosialidase
MGGQKTPTTTTQISKQEPWDQAKPYYEAMYKNAQEAVNKTNKQAYKGDFVATDAASGGGINQGLDFLRANAGTGLLGSGSDEVRQLGLDTVSGKYLDPSTNPFLKAVADQSTAGVMRGLTESALPAIRDASIAQGAYGGARQDVQENQVVSAANKEALDAANQLYYTNYAAERDRMAGGADLLNMADEMSRQTGLEYMRIGDAEKALKQAEIDNSRAKFMEKKQAPWYGLGEMAQILGTGGFRSTATESTQPAQSSTGSWIQAGVGGLAGIASLAKALPALFALSDRTTKTDVKKVATHEATGIDIYSYRYKGDPKSYPKVVGPMAQDVEKVFPDAVFEIGGKKAVAMPVVDWLNKTVKEAA